MANRYVKRDIEKTLARYIRQFPVVALTGPRQSGKSTLLKHLLGGSYRYVSFDNPAVRERAVNDPDLFLDSLPGNVVFDEIQYLPELIPYIKIRVDAARQKKGRYILTGSQQFIMMKHLSESLAGRIGLLNLLPFSISEIGRMKDVRPSAAFQEFAFKGLYPEPVVDKKLIPQDWFSSYIQTYIERDVRLIQNIGNLRDFHRFITLLAGRCSQILNMSNFASEIGVSVPTIRNWLSVLEASFIVYLLPPFFNNLGKRVVKSPKIYFIDTGLVCHLLGIRAKEQIMDGPFSGALFENFCLSEFLKCKFNNALNENFFYWRTHAGNEVDMIIEKGRDLFLYEFKCSKSIRKSMAEGIESFIESNPGSKIKNAVIASLVEESFPVSDDVKAQNYLEAVETNRG